MRKVLSFLTACFVCIGATDAAVRTTNSSGRNTTLKQSQNVTVRDSATPNASRNVDAGARTIVSRTTAPNTSRATVSRATTTNTTKTRDGNTISRTSTSRATIQPSRLTRAATESPTFSSGYNSCRDAYFTCMDQFCATADDSYRRCFCSSRLSEIKSKQRALGDTADQIQNFKDLNIDVIPKTAAEVNAMLTASSGEYAASKAKDTSESAQKLAGISSVLTNTKSKSLSMAGTLDIAGDINAIWANTELANGVNIANLSGETLYNAVHSQCADLVSEHCESKSTLNMVIAAYGMYIENDCTMLSNALDKKKTTANTAIRETEREMENARLQNYNAHNATSINDCVAKVRNDITADTACGTNYVHCLDVSGLYLDRTTGEPIYTANFYKLETMLSLTGDVLTNQMNRMLVAELNRKRDMAEKSLSTCQDLADDVWDEFMRQAIAEIYQGQQSKIRQVKEECLDVVNKCYDSQTASLRDFSNTKEQLLLGSQLELSEEMCRDKLNACSNLYGGGTSGMRELVATMQNITSQKIAQNCLTTLQEYVTTLCAPPSNDTLHSYPYACRAYAPGEQKYAIDWGCQNAIQTVSTTAGSSRKTAQTKEDTESATPQRALQATVQSSPSTTLGSPARSTTKSGTRSSSNGYTCDEDLKQYTSCAEGYYLSECIGLNSGFNSQTPICYDDSSTGNLKTGAQWSSCQVNITNTHFRNKCISKEAKVTFNSDGTSITIEGQPNASTFTINTHYKAPDSLKRVISGNQTNVKYPGGTKCPYFKQTDQGSGGESGEQGQDDSGQTYYATPERCGDYVGSLYQKVVRYALQACMRPSTVENPSNGTTPISTAVLNDVNTTMDAVRFSMSKQLQNECERLGGYWVTTQYDSDGYGSATLSQFARFYSETGANTKWGYCADKSDAAKYFDDSSTTTDN